MKKKAGEAEVEKPEESCADPGGNGGQGAFVSILLALWEYILLTAASAPTQVRPHSSTVIIQHCVLPVHNGWAIVVSRGMVKTQVGTGSEGH